MSSNFYIKLLDIKYDIYFFMYFYIESVWCWYQSIYDMAYDIQITPIERGSLIQVLRPFTWYSRQFSPRTRGQDMLTPTLIQVG